MPQPDARVRFFDLLRASISNGSLAKLTLGKFRGADKSLKNVFVRPVALRGGARLSFVFRHDTRDVTKNYPADEALALVEKLLGAGAGAGVGAEFLDAHLFTATQTAQLECQVDGKARLRIVAGASRSPRRELEAPATLGHATLSHDRARQRAIPAGAPWLRALGVTNERAQVREGMSAKFRQINKFAELLSHLAAEAKLLEEPWVLPLPLPLPPGKTQPTATRTARAETGLVAQAALADQSDRSDQSDRADQSDQPERPSPEAVLRLADMGCGKGYLTFAAAALFGARARVLGIEARAELVALCNRVARETGFANLVFKQGTIAGTPLDFGDGGDAGAGAGGGVDTVGDGAAGDSALDVLIALHACDTATDDAIARGVAAGARLIVVSPCCQKELRAWLVAPAALAPALRHGIFLERQAEFVTDALRALLLECAGYRVKVFEFVSTEHTAKNLMIAATKTGAVDGKNGRNGRDGRNGMVGKDGKDGTIVARDAAALEKVRAFAAFYGVRKQTLASRLGIALA